MLWFKKQNKTKTKGEQVRGIRSPGDKALRKALMEKVISEQRLERGEAVKGLSRGRALQ